MQGRELEDEKRSFWIEDNVNLYHIKTTDKDYTCHTANHAIIKQILSVQVADRLYRSRLRRRETRKLIFAKFPVDVKPRANVFTYILSYSS